MGLENCKSYEMRDLERESLKDMYEQISEHFQPERSKREDFCLTKLADQYIEEWNPLPFCRHADMEESYIKGVYDFSDWLKQKMRCSEHCGNTVREVQ